MALRDAFQANSPRALEHDGQPMCLWVASVYGVETLPLKLPAQADVEHNTDAEVTSSGLDNSEGYFVTDLSVSRLRLQREQHVSGWCVLLLRRHVREPHELPPEERIAFFEDMVRVGRALERVYAAQKINYSIMGNIVPHLHAHIQTVAHQTVACPRA
jgi:HIT domain-containing protein